MVEETEKSQRVKCRQKKSTVKFGNELVGTSRTNKEMPRQSCFPREGFDGALLALEGFQSRVNATVTSEGGRVAEMTVAFEAGVRFVAGVNSRVDRKS